MRIRSPDCETQDGVRCRLYHLEVYATSVTLRTSAESCPQTKKKSIVIKTFSLRILNAIFKLLTIVALHRMSSISPNIYINVWSFVYQLDWQHDCEEKHIKSAHHVTQDLIQVPFIEHDAPDHQGNHK